MLSANFKTKRTAAACAVSLRQHGFLVFNSGRITASLKSEGKQPETSDVVHNKAAKDESSPRTSFTSHVGTESSWQVLVGAEPISFSNSSTVTTVHSVNDGVRLVQDVTQRHRSTRRTHWCNLISKKTSQIHRQYDRPYHLQISRRQRHGAFSTVAAYCLGNFILPEVVFLILIYRVHHLQFPLPCTLACQHQNVVASVFCISSQQLVHVPRAINSEIRKREHSLSLLG